MTFSWDLNTATLIAIAVQIVFLIVYLVKTNGKAHAAYERAEKAEKLAAEAHEKVSLVQAGVAMLREQVAKDHPDHDMLGDMEARLTKEIHRLGDRLDRFINEK